MLASGVTASLMSLGAIDFGLIVDSLGHHGRELRASTGASWRRCDRACEVIRDAAIEVRKPTMFGELIIAIVYLPILRLQGTEGKLFRPMALTVLFALAGSMVLSMTFMPRWRRWRCRKRAPDKEFWSCAPETCLPAARVRCDCPIR